MGSSGRLITSADIADLSIVNADINSAAAIAKSKLAALDIVNADVNGAAAIAVAKLAHLGAGNVLRSNGTANVGGQIVAGDIGAQQVIRAALGLGAVGTANIEDAAITTAKIAANAVTQVLSGLLGGTTTSVHPTFVTLAPISITGSGGVVYLSVIVALTSTGTCNAVFAWNIDGGTDQQMAMQTIVASEYRMTCALANLGAISGGHTINIRWATTANLVAANAGSFYTAVEYKR